VYLLRRAKNETLLTKDGVLDSGIISY
jgi:hypothetical protein